MSELNELPVILENTDTNKKNLFEFVTIIVTVLTLVLTCFTAWSQLVENKKDRQLESVVAFRIKQLETVIDSISIFGYQSSNLYSLYIKRDKEENLNENFLKEFSSSEIETQQTLDKILLNLNKNNQYYKEIDEWVVETSRAYGDPEIYRTAKLIGFSDPVKSDFNAEFERIRDHISSIPPKPTKTLKKYIEAEWKLIDSDL